MLRNKAVYWLWATSEDDAVQPRAAVCLALPESSRHSVCSRHAHRLPHSIVTRAPAGEASHRARGAGKQHHTTSWRHKREFRTTSPMKRLSSEWLPLSSGPRPPSGSRRAETLVGVRQNGVTRFSRCLDTTPNTVADAAAADDNGSGTKGSRFSTELPALSLSRRPM